MSRETARNPRTSVCYEVPAKRFFGQKNPFRPGNWNAAQHDDAHDFFSIF